MQTLERESEVTQLWTGKIQLDTYGEEIQKGRGVLFHLFVP
jgi:hypothetical protein